MPKLTGGAFKHIEGEIERYFEIKRELESLKLEYLQSSGLWDPDTHMRKTNRVYYLEDICLAIRQVYEKLNKEEQRLVNLYYWQKPQELTWDGIAIQLHVSKKTAQRWRDKIVEDIAVKMGWM